MDNEKATFTSNISHPTYKKHAIVVAGGTGTRMQSAVPKQFLLLHGIPVLMHTINAFHRSDSQPELILVLPQHYHQHWIDLCIEHHFNIPHQLVAGGETRFHSVKNGLDLIEVESVIAIHDAVRPLITTEVIDNAYRYANQHGNAVVAIPSRDSVRRVVNEKSTALNRDQIYLVQTPQTFQSAQLKTAYLQHYLPAFTDDASVVEHAGFEINIVKGNDTNIKITYPEDIAIAELLLKHRLSLKKPDSLV